MSTQWNPQLSRYVSKVIERLEQNVQKQIDNKYKTNEHILKYLSRNMELQSC